MINDIDIPETEARIAKYKQENAETIRLNHEREEQYAQYLKELEGPHRRTPEQLSLTDNSSLTVFSDRKGDILNVKYGRLHAGDVPKYNLVGRK